MNRKYKNSFNKDNIDRMFSEPNDTGSIRMLSIHPQMGIKMILECDSELEEIFCDDSEIIFSLDTKNIYLSCPATELLHIGKRVYLMGTGVAYRLNRDDEYADMSSDEMAETCLELFYLNAQEAAISTIQCLIRELNPNVENLTIDVEFY